MHPTQAHLLLQVMRKNYPDLAWLSMPVQQWKKDPNYIEVEEVVTKLCVINDPTERAVKAVGDRIGSVRSEKAIQATPLTLEDLRRLSSDIKRGTFTKKQLSIMIKKMLKIEDAE